MFGGGGGGGGGAGSVRVRFITFLTIYEKLNLIHYFNNFKTPSQFAAKGLGFDFRPDLFSNMYANGIFSLKTLSVGLGLSASILST